MNFGEGSRRSPNSFRRSLLTVVFVMVGLIIFFWSVNKYYFEPTVSKLPVTVEALAKSNSCIKTILKVKIQNNTPITNDDLAKAKKICPQESLLEKQKNALN